MTPKGLGVGCLRFADDQQLPWVRQHIVLPDQLLRKAQRIPRQHLLHRSQHPLRQLQVAGFDRQPCQACR
jgi:hypothetical protein